VIRGSAFTERLYLNRSRSGPALAVIVFHTQKDMRAWQKAWRKKVRGKINTLAVGQHTQAQVLWCYRQVPGFRAGVHGLALFHLGKIGPGVLAHEMTHVANFVKPPPSEPGGWNNDEKHAWLVGWLVTQFYRKFHRTWWGKDAE
jgi:hypothetical protein